jgi:spoIIIJ-associated protein
MKERVKIDIEGKTVQEAIGKALKELRVKRNEVKIEILCEEEKGLFGMPGAKPAKVRATLLGEQKTS